MSFALAGLNDWVEIVTTGTVAYDYVTHRGVASAASSPMVPTDAGGNEGSVAVAGTQNISGTPASAGDRWEVWFDIFNSHASSSFPVTVRMVRNSVAKIAFRTTLFPGWTLSRNRQGTWFVLDANGGVVMGGAAASDTVAGLIMTADVAAMEGAANLIEAVVPGRQHRHPAHPKVWGMATVTTNVPTLQASYGVTSITDTATGTITFTFSTAFSSVNYGVQASIEMSSTTLTATLANRVVIRSGSRTTTSVQLDSMDSTATTHLRADPASWSLIISGDQ